MNNLRAPHRIAPLFGSGENVVPLRRNLKVREHQKLPSFRNCGLMNYQKVSFLEAQTARRDGWNKTFFRKRGIVIRRSVSNVAQTRPALAYIVESSSKCERECESCRKQIGH